MRRNRTLVESRMRRDPIAQFKAWIEEALRLPVPLAEAMSLATATSKGRPSARMVLLKGVDERGFAFFTNTHSRKAREIAGNPRAALVFHWQALHRQVRVEGRVERIPADESDAYFHTRPRGARLGAWASPQSRVISKTALMRRVRELSALYRGKDIPRPAYWGGYRVVPASIEFWQGRPDRLHDRIRYLRDRAGRWKIQRLAP